MTILALLTFLLLLAPVSARAEEPTGYLEFPWGTEHEALLDECRPLDEIPLPGPIRMLLCAATVASEWRPTLNLIDGKLAGYILRVPHSDYRQLKASVIERFGPPASVRKNTMQNGMGATFTRESLRWSWASGTTAILHEGLTRTDTSALFVETPPWTKAWAAQQREKIERAKKAF